ncbi:MAG: DUF5615 family PIN-like protein [Siphonobacter sp.]
MKFLANENFPRASIDWLRSNGVEVWSIQENNPGISDKQVMQLSIENELTILTFDRDYGELIFKFGYKPLPGVVFFRWDHFAPDFPGKFIYQLITSTDVELIGKFSVIDEHFIIRQRKI